MSTCPICHAPITPKLHNCAYCGVSLADRKHKAPSQAAPALLTRPSAQPDPLGLEVSATPASELSTMNLTMDSVNDSHESFTLDLSGSEDDALVIETPLPQLVVPEIEPQNTTPDIHSTMAQFSQEAQYSYVPSTEQYFSEPQRPIEPRLATIDEASDGLGPLDVDLDQHQLLFPDEPVIGSTRSTAKLSDLSGVNPLSGVATPALEPSFDIHNSALSQAVSSSAHHIHTPLPLREDTATLSPKSSIRLVSQGLLFTAFTLAVLWGLGLSESLTGFSSLFSQHSDPQPTTGSLNPSKSALTNSKVSNEIKFLGDQDTQESSESSTVSTSTVEEDEIIFDDHKVELETAKSVKTVKSQATKSKVRSKASAQNTKHDSLKKQNSSKQKAKPKKRSVSYTGLIQQGEKLLMRGRVKQAESYFKKALKLNPSKAEALAQLAWCQLAKKNTRSAIGKFKQALSKNPVHGDSLYGLGYSYEKLKESKQAIHYFELYLKRYPQGKKVGVIKNKMRRLKR